MTTPPRYIPKPVFDTLAHVIDQYKAVQAHDKPRQLIKQWLTHCLKETTQTLPPSAITEYQWVLSFLYSYRGSADTFGAYRRELERFLQWSWFVKSQSLVKHQREDIEAFIEFCIKPPKRWIGLKTVARFKSDNGVRIPNQQWRPFDARITKTAHQQGQQPTKADYHFSQPSLKAVCRILSSFYHYLLQEDVTKINPLLLMRQKSKFIQRDVQTPVIRRLSNQQWQMVINVAKERAKQDNTHERTVFMLSCLYGMYLRISELAASNRWQPTMNDFYKDADGYWWFRTVGKGNKARCIALSSAMLAALKHYRVQYLNLPPYPTPDEKTPLIPHLHNKQKPITSMRPIRSIVQTCFDEAANKLASQGNQQAADMLRTATVHWLRHTGISDDVQHRPREHVRDDAGHSSSAITDRYINVELTARAKSAKKKRTLSEPMTI